MNLNLSRDVNVSQLLRGNTMNPTIAAALIGGLTGLCAGITGSLAAPWVQWAVEKKRRDLEYKQKIISEIRALMDETPDIENIMASSYWGFIYSNLDVFEKERISPSTILFLASGDLEQSTLKKQIISEMLHRLEVQWKLVIT